MVSKKSWEMSDLKDIHQLCLGPGSVTFCVTFCFCFYKATWKSTWNTLSDIKRGRAVWPITELWFN